MTEHEIETSRTTQSNKDLDRIETIQRWFAHEYPYRLQTIARYSYLGIKLPETRYALELEAYEKENELRALTGKEPLPKPKIQSVF